MPDFHLFLNDDEKTYLKELVTRSISSWLDKSDDTPEEPDSSTLKRELGAFVTLKLNGQLRGCIGNIQGTGKLYKTIWEMARAAAFNDPRFAPLTREEAEQIEVEISILGPVEPCFEPQQIKVGKHGLIVSRGSQSGLLLPQVPVELGWDRETFLKQTCVKAGLPKDSWNKVGTTLLWFEAVVF